MSPKASEDWAERFQDEFGIKARGLRSDSIEIAIPPETVYAKLSEARKMLDEIYGDDHPLK